MVSSSEQKVATACGNNQQCENAQYARSKFEAPLTISFRQEEITAIDRGMRDDIPVRYCTSRSPKHGPVYVVRRSGVHDTTIMTSSQRETNKLTSQFHDEFHDQSTTEKGRFSLFSLSQPVKTVHTRDDWLLSFILPSPFASGQQST
jgi:hypothetical protein